MADTVIDSDEDSDMDMTTPQEVGEGQAELMTEHKATRAEVRNLNFFYGDNQALKNINLPIVDRRVTALIGPSGCGKSTLLRCFNRMHDLYPGNRYEGEIRLMPENINIASRTSIRCM